MQSPESMKKMEGQLEYLTGAAELMQSSFLPETEPVLLPRSSNQDQSGYSATAEVNTRKVEALRPVSGNIIKIFFKQSLCTNAFTIFSILLDFLCNLETSLSFISI